MLPGRTGVLDCAQMGSLHRVAIAHTSADASAHDAPTPAAPAASDRTGNDHTALNLSVRPVGLRDVPTVASFRPMQRFHLPDAQVLGYRLEIEDAKAGLPFLRGRRPAFVARSGDRAVGVAQFLALPPDQRYLAAMIAHDYPSHAWALRACAVSVREMERALEELATETAEQEALGRKIQEKFQARLSALGSEVQLLHNRLLSIEMNKLVEIEKVLTKEQRLRLSAERQAAVMAAVNDANTANPAKPQ